MSWPHLPASSVAASIGDVEIVIDRRSGRVVSFDSIGSLVLRQRDRFTDLDDAATALHEVFAGDSTAIHAALERFQLDVDAAMSPPAAARESPWTNIAIGGRTRVAPPSSTHPAICVVDALGVGVAVTTHDDDLAATVHRLLASLPTADQPTHRIDLWSDGPHRAMLTLDGRLLCNGVPPLNAVAEMLAVLTALPLSVPRSTLLMHASAIDVNGVIVAMCGASNQGKSSVAVALTKLGGGYLTDELVELDPASGATRGFTRPIGLEGPVRDSYPELQPPWTLDGAFRWMVEPSTAGTIGQPGSLGLVVLLEYAPDAALAVRHINPLDALVGLIPMVFNLDDVTEAMLTDLGLLLARVPTIALRHPGALTAASAILELTHAS